MSPVTVATIISSISLLLYPLFEGRLCRLIRKVRCRLFFRSHPPFPYPLDPLHDPFIRGINHLFKVKIGGSTRLPDISCLFVAIILAPLTTVLLLCAKIQPHISSAIISMNFLSGKLRCNPDCIFCCPL